MNVLQLFLQGNFPTSGGQVSLTLSILLIIVGFLYCFLGYKAFKVVLFLTGAFVGGAVMNYIWPGIFPMILGALLGGFIAMGLYIVGIFILGAILGALLVSLFFLPVGIEAPMFITIVIAVLGGVLAVYLQRALIIIASAVYGAGMIVNGFDIIMSGGTILSPVQPFDLNSFTIVHVILAIALAVGGMIIQFATTIEPPAEEPQPLTAQNPQQ